MTARRSSSAATSSSSLRWLASGLLVVVACSNQITYSRVDVELPDSGPGTGGAASPGIGGKGAGGAGGAGGVGGAGAGGADAGSDAPIGSGGMIDARDAGTGGMGTRDAGIGGMGTGGAGTGGTGTGGAGMGGMGTGGAGMGGMGTGGAGMGGMGIGGAAGGPAIDNAQYNFEASAQGWVPEGGFTAAARMPAVRFAGANSLGATLTYAPPTEVSQELSVLPPAGTGPVAGNVLTFHVFVPANAAGVVSWVLPYVQDSANPQSFIYTFDGATTLVYGGWNTITLAVPTNIVPPIVKIAVQVHTAGTVAFTNTLYVDSISW